MRRIRLFVKEAAQFHQSGPVSFVKEARFLSSKAAPKHVTPSSGAASKSKDIKESKSFVMNMFLGKVVPDLIFPYPCSVTEDQKQTTRMTVDSLNKVLKEKNNPMLNDERGKLDPAVIEALRAQGYFGASIPPEYGGLGLSSSQMARIGESQFSQDMALGGLIGVHTGVGTGTLLLAGNEAQKRKYLPRLASGELIAAFALTEPNTGSDSANIQTTATRSADGSHFVLNGSKMYITNGDVAGLFTVFAQVSEKDPATGKMKRRMSAFLVERAFGGLSSGPAEVKMGIRASGTTAVFLDNVRVPAENLLGKVGDGFKIAVQTLNAGRFGLVAGAAGVMRDLIARAVEHSKTRVQFGKALAEYGTTQEKLARMAVRQYVSETFAYLLSGLIDRGLGSELQLEAAIAKVYATDSEWYVADETLQLFGGSGYLRSTGIERYLRDVRVARIVEGANDVLRLFISLTGLQYAGSRLKELSKSGAILDMAATRLQSRFGGSTLLANHIHPSLQQEAALTSKQIAQFATSTQNLLIKYGKGITEEQMVLQRVATASIATFAQVAALSRASRALSENTPGAEHERRLVQLLCLEGHESAMRALAETEAAAGARLFQLCTGISRDVCSNGGVMAHRALGF